MFIPVAGFSFRSFIPLLASWFVILLPSVLSAQTQPASTPASRPAPVARTGTFAADHNPALPTLFLIGDSTVKNSWDRGTDGLWGWGHAIAAYFDTSKINVDNQALGGTSSHSYQTNNWPGVLALVKKGDFVILQFGTNDNAGASLTGNGDETQPARGGRGGAGGGDVHSYGWYIRKYITDTREKGASPIVCSQVPRRRFQDGKIAVDGHVAVAKAAAEQEHAFFIDLHGLIAAKYDALGPDETAKLFGKNAQGVIETVHTNWQGSILNAQCVIEGLKSLKDSPLTPYIAKDPKPPVKPSTDPTDG